MGDYPKLRNGLEAIPVDHQGRRFIVLRDCLGYARDSLLIPLPLAALLDRMNGANSLRELQAHYVGVTGELLFMENLQDFVSRLDEALFLESEHFLQLVTRERDGFHQDPLRRMQFGGKSYPLDPVVLRSQLDGFLATARESVRAPAERPGPLVALMAPHIDLSAGGVCFAHAYQAALEAPAPATWVVLGTGHEPIDNYFALTLKDFETPLGPIQCDLEFAQDVLKRSSRNLLAGEYLHRKEHTIEFQAVFLAHTQPLSKMVPLLCSFSLEDWQTDRAHIDEVAGLLRHLALERGHAVGFIASVDLAHIGPRYGDRFRPHAGTVREHLDADRELLESLGKCDPLEFMERVGLGSNRRRVCGMASLYVLAKVLEGLTEGELLDHAHAVVDRQNSFVTFAAMAFYGKAAEGGRPCSPLSTDRS
jgi:AmmeMemoRadiSam system protein B